MSVSDSDRHLYCAYARAPLEVGCDGFRRVRVESTVSVHQADDHVLARTALQDRGACEVFKGRIEGCAFTLASLG